MPPGDFSAHPKLQIRSLKFTVHQALFQVLGRKPWGSLLKELSIHSDVQRLECTTGVDHYHPQGQPAGILCHWQTRRFKVSTDGVGGHITQVWTKGYFPNGVFERVWPVSPTKAFTCIRSMEDLSRKPFERCWNISLDSSLSPLKCRIYCSLSVNSRLYHLSLMLLQWLCVILFEGSLEWNWEL